MGLGLGMGIEIDEMLATAVPESVKRVISAA
jgi:hypothetical protein